MAQSTKFILDSGNPEEYRQIAELAKQHGQELWGATTNPSLIAKNIMGKKGTQDEADRLHKQFIEEILSIVPGAVSAEVYADETTTGEQMAAQGRDIATWHERIVVKLPTTVEGFKARTALRKEGIMINNTLVFSQEQIYAISLHEHIVQTEMGVKPGTWPSFISPFVGRLDDKGLDGMQLVEHGMEVKALVETETWMLEASVRNAAHIKRGLDAGTELITAPAKIYTEWFVNQDANNDYAAHLAPIEVWSPSDELRSIRTIDGFMDAIISGKLNIQHELTDAGIKRFVEDWKAVIA